jgi:drug/metabolite transporter (DMT)-like permease
VSTSDIALGGMAGALGLTGLVLMYSALATGEMSIVAPIIGALAASIPVAWDVATGGSIGTIQWIGIAMSVTAVLLLAGRKATGGAHMMPTIKAVGAAISFAMFYIAMSYTSEASGLWPLVAARSVTVPIAFVVAFGLGVAAIPQGRILRLVALTGAADMVANLAIVTAVQRGPLGVNAVLSSLYPAVTVLAALVILKEYPTTIQRFGIVLAVAAAILLAL